MLEYCFHFQKNQTLKLYSYFSDLFYQGHKSMMGISIFLRNTSNFSSIPLLQYLSKSCIQAAQIGITLRWQLRNTENCNSQLPFIGQLNTFGRKIGGKIIELNAEHIQEPLKYLFGIVTVFPMVGNIGQDWNIT